jgi:DNA-binding protein HU-beta
MNKISLAKHIAQHTGLSIQQVSKMLNAFSEVVSLALCNNEKVSIPGFGAFSVVFRKARAGRNPKTGKQLILAPSASPKFLVSKMLKQSVLSGSAVKAVLTDMV